jgi:hypothetical protein
MDIYVCIYVYTYMSIQRHKYMCIYIYSFIHIYICVYIYIAAEEGIPVFQDVGGAEREISDHHMRQCTYISPNLTGDHSFHQNVLMNCYLYRFSTHIIFFLSTNYNKYRIRISLEYFCINIYIYIYIYIYV